MLKSVTHGYAMGNAFDSVLEQISLHAPGTRRTAWQEQSVNCAAAQTSCRNGEGIVIHCDPNTSLYFRRGQIFGNFYPPLDKAPDSLYTMHYEQCSRWGDPMNLNATSKANILKTSRELIQQNGWAGVNIRSVAAACGVSVGCIYNYFASKTELLSATVESIWSDIFHHPEDEVVFQDTLSCVRWMYQQLEDGCQRYPGFFTHHALGFVRQDTADGKQQMQRAWRHILEALCVVLQNDTKIRADAFTEEFTVEKFAEILFSLMLSALVRQDFDPSTVLEIVRRAIY